MKIGDVVMPKDFVSDKAGAGIVVEIKHSDEKYPDYRKPTTFKCSFPHGAIKKWYYRHELEVVLG